MCNGDFHRIIFVHKRIGKNGKLFKMYKYTSLGTLKNFHFSVSANICEFICTNLSTTKSSIIALISCK